jgi:hypothetical protein
MWSHLLCAVQTKDTIMEHARRNAIVCGFHSIRDGEVCLSLEESADDSGVSSHRVATGVSFWMLRATAACDAGELSCRETENFKIPSLYGAK